MTWTFVAFLFFLCLGQIHADAGLDKVVKPGSLAGIEKGKATSACDECKKVMSVLRVAKDITAKEYAHGLEAICSKFKGPLGNFCKAGKGKEMKIAKVYLEDGSAKVCKKVNIC
ncbi:hypothetical protein DdX_15023 [Ditylenchus destructor]|uniref:Saposin B-type domain-containing protein n=1 Tax=Ditylenchus destructor TaxID=166010 RepID=A0AAD4QV61_9BILA|nr:hypothetical protein DdX_15023 [Ditylenchus destructor]